MARGVRMAGSGGQDRRAARCAARRDDASRTSLYDEVTQSIIAQLEAGVFPWVQPWSTATTGVGLPRNAISGRPYSGSNVLILWGAVFEGGYLSQEWLTFQQALAAGGCVRKGERGRTVFYADRFTPQKDKTQGHEQGGGEDEAIRSIPFLKRFTVFNVAQCDGLPERFTAAPQPLPEREPHHAAEALIAASGADFRIGGGEAFYVPALDYVQVPPQPAFPAETRAYVAKIAPMLQASSAATVVASALPVQPVRPSWTQGQLFAVRGGAAADATGSFAAAAPPTSIRASSAPLNGLFAPVSGSRPQ